MSSITLDNGIELYGTHEESDGGIEYRITRLEALRQAGVQVEPVSFFRSLTFGTTEKFAL